MDIFSHYYVLLFLVIRWANNTVLSRRQVKLENKPPRSLKSKNPENLEEEHTNASFIKRILLLYFPDKREKHPTGTQVDQMSKTDLSII